MTIQYLGDGTFLVKTKTTELTTGPAINIGELTLSGPGEYEAGDAQIKGYQDAYLITADDVNLLYVYNPNGLSEELIKAIEEDIDVFVLTVDRDPSHVKSAMKTMNDLDPVVTLPAVDGPDHPFCKEIGGCPPAQDELKVNLKDQEEGERKVVVLIARPRARR